jgi:hypothetical protein
MNTHLKSFLMVAAIVGLVLPGIAVAQKSGGGVVGGARLHPGTWGNQRASRSYTVPRQMYRSTAPVIVRSSPAPKSVANAPTSERRFSYEPAQKVEAKTPVKKNVPNRWTPRTKCSFN